MKQEINVFIDYALYTSILKMDVFSKEVFLINLRQEVNLYLETLFNNSIADCTKKIGVNKNNEVLIIYQDKFKDTDIIMDTVEKVIKYSNQKSITIELTKNNNHNSHRMLHYLYSINKE